MGAAPVPAIIVRLSALNFSDLCALCKLLIVKDLRNGDCGNKQLQAIDSIDIMPAFISICWEGDGGTERLHP